MSLNMASCSTEAIYLPYLHVLTGLSSPFFPTKLQFACVSLRGRSGTKGEPLLWSAAHEQQTVSILHSVNAA